MNCGTAQLQGANQQRQMSVAGWLRLLLAASFEARAQGAGGRRRYRQKAAPALRGTLVFGVLFLVAPLVAYAASPEESATEFVQHIQRGSLDNAKSLLDGSGYRYRHPGGDDIYFAYESGYDPNLAFLVGQPFVIGTSSVRRQRSAWYPLDRTNYADVTIPLRFTTYRPWLLPAPLAFGRAMDFINFINFVTAPETNPERLSLRIRPSIEPGLIKMPKPQFVAPPAPPSGDRAVTLQPARVDTHGALLGSRPVDPAPVTLPSGEPLTPAQLSRLLPRLGAITVNVSLIHRGYLSSWKVVRWNFTTPVLVTESGEVVTGVGSGPARERP